MIELLVERLLVLDKLGDCAVAFSVVMKIIQLSGCLEKINVSFSGLLFVENELFVCVDDSCRQNFLSRLSEHMHSLKVEIKRLNGEAQKITTILSMLESWVRLTVTLYLS